MGTEIPYKFYGLQEEITYNVTRRFSVSFLVHLLNSSIKSHASRSSCSVLVTPEPFLFCFRKHIEVMILYQVYFKYLFTHGGQNVWEIERLFSSLTKLTLYSIVILHPFVF